MMDCRFSWEDWSPPTAPLCTKLNELLLYEKQHIRLYEMTAEEVNAVV